MNTHSVLVIFMTGIFFALISPFTAIADLDFSAKQKSAKT
jgi:hypothetical protein